MEWLLGEMGEVRNRGVCTEAEQPGRTCSSGRVGLKKDCSEKGAAWTNNQECRVSGYKKGSHVVVPGERKKRRPSHHRRKRSANLAIQ